MLFVNSNDIADKILLNGNLPTSISIYYDTEFTNFEKMTVDSIQVFIPEIQDNFSLVYPYEDLNEDFTLWINPIKDLGIDVEYLNEDSLDVLINSVYEKFIEIKENSSNNRQLKKNCIEAINNGYFDDTLEDFNLNRSYLKYSYDSKLKCGELLIYPPKLDISLYGFFSDVDLFKSIGKNHQSNILSSDLESRRSIKFRSKNTLTLNPIYYNGILYEPQIHLRDVLNRFPVLSGNGLDNQCRVYQAQITKIDLVNMVRSPLLIGKNKGEIMGNMSLLKELEPELFYKYAGIDTLATYNLSQKHQELLDHIRSDFNLEKTEVKDTTGSNVSKFLNDLYIKHFSTLNPEVKLTRSIEKSNGDLKIEELNSEKIIIHQRKLGTLDNVASLELNNFGLQTFRTVGGLLYSRVSKYPYLSGLFGDLDEQSCYSTKLSNMNIYLGCPVVTTFKQQKNKPKLKEVLSFLELNCYRDSWFIRVSGKLKKAVNTLILSDLRFKNKREKFNTIWDKLKSNQEYLGEFNAYKVASKDAESTILTKQIKFGLITQDTIDCLKLLPEKWYEEFLDLSVDCIVFFPIELCCSNLEELADKYDEYPNEEYVESWNPKTGLKEIKSIYSKSNLALVFPAYQYFNELRLKRSQYKKEKNPIQEVYKLFSNSAYGALACEHLPCNNLLAANIITASARSTSWMMINALNGFQVITDGCTFSWENIPLGYKFKDLLEENPNYLKHFEPSIKSKITVENNDYQSWIDCNFKAYMRDFYNVDENHLPCNLFNFELKSEDFNGNNTVIFTTFINHGSGSYVKGFNDNYLLIDSNDFDLSDSKFTKVKARSFKGSDQNLLKWYVESLSGDYKLPVIYSENQIIKFGLGNVLAIQLLNRFNLDCIAHPMGFSRKIYKVMKLITRSQFLFNTESQLRNFETNLSKLDKLGKVACNSKFWSNLNLNELLKYGDFEVSNNFDYVEYCKNHDLGLGLEVLCFGKNKTISDIRNFIADKIDSDCKNFNASLNLDRAVNTHASKLKYLFAAIYLLRIEAELKLKNQLVKSVNEPTILTVSKDDKITLAKILDLDSYE